MRKQLCSFLNQLKIYPPDNRAKETYRFISDDEIEETFEIAEPNKDFAVYSKVKLVRQK